MYDILIKEGMIVDFEKNKILIGDIGINGNKITFIGQCSSTAKKVIDASGKVVSPGFIDIHMHEEKIKKAKNIEPYDIANYMILMGVTTGIAGNCGDNYQDIGQGHPRGAGTFPKVIGKYVREDKELDLIEALKKMTKLPANRLGLKAKGEIKEGMDADIVIFDFNSIRNCSTFEKPTLPPKGIEYVLVNGSVAVEKNKIINKRLEKAIRKNNS